MAKSTWLLNTTHLQKYYGVLYEVEKAILAM